MKKRTKPFAEEEKAFIRTEAARGVSKRRIAGMLGVSETKVWYFLSPVVRKKAHDDALKWNQKNKERVSALQKKYYWGNRERVLLKNRNNYQKRQARKKAELEVKKELLIKLARERGII